MDWIRRNWPDLLIGLALLAVISGIIATLLTGGTILPFGRSQQSGTTTSQTQAPPAQTQQQQDQQQAQQPEDSAATQEAADPLVDPLPLLVQNTPQQTEDEAFGVLPDGRVDPLAAAQQDAQAAQQAAGAESGLPVIAVRPGDAQQPAAQQAAVQAPATQQAVTDPAPAQSVVSGASPSVTQPYTVGVGAFRNTENAQRQADIFRQAGYPVVVAQQGDLSVVLLGPYSAESEAERVRATVASGGFDVAPIVYAFRPDGEPAAPAAQSQPVTPAPAAEQPAAQQPAAQPAAEQPAAQEPAAQQPAPASTASGARFLQVGAYSSAANAQAQIDTLRSLGYSAAQEQDGQLIRVVVGPYTDAELTDARNRLAAQGIDSVPR